METTLKKMNQATRKDHDAFRDIENVEDSGRCAIRCPGWLTLAQRASQSLLVLTALLRPNFHKGIHIRCLTKTTHRSNWYTDHDQRTDALKQPNKVLSFRMHGTGPDI